MASPEPTNQFLPFGTDEGANVQTNSEYSSDAYRGPGNQAGIARSKFMNKIWRQASIIGHIISQTICDVTGRDALDDGTTETLIANFKAAMTIQGKDFYGFAQETPDQTIALFGGTVYFGTTKVEFDETTLDLGTGGDEEVSALTEDYYNKILFTLNSSGAITKYEGTEAADLESVVEPSIPSGEFCLIMVDVQDDGNAGAGTIVDIEQTAIHQIQQFGFVGGTADDTAYGEAWDESLLAPTQNRLYEKFESLSFAAAGANTDITSLSGLTTPLSVAQGGTGLANNSKLIAARANWNGTGTAALRDSWNVAGLVDNGTGDQSVTIDDDLANDDYAAVSTCEGIVSPQDTVVAQVEAFAVGSCRVITRIGNNGEPNDRTYVSLIIVGDQ